jgi:uncharacterized membrane protein
VSAALEILGGLGLFLPVTRRAATWGPIALLIAAFPANIYAADLVAAPAPAKAIA